MDTVFEAMARLLRGEPRRMPRPGHPRGRRSTYQPVLDDTLRAMRWAPASSR